MTSAELDRTHLLRAIVERPGYDVARLVYADLMEENGQSERAEFVRVQIELASLDAYHLSCTGNKCPACWPRRQREHHLLYAFSGIYDGDKSYSNKAAWCLSLLDAIPHHPWEAVTYRRGFVDEVRLPLAAWLEHGAGLVLGHPLTVVRLTDREPEMAGRSADSRCWLREEDDYDSPASIHAGMWHLLAGHLLPIWSNAKDYPDLDSARTALSLAAINQARSAAGLPPLEDTPR